MWRALSLLVGLLLGVGIYVAVSGGASAHAAAPRDVAGPSAGEFGYALAAGAIALAAAVMMRRPRIRIRR